MKRLRVRFLILISWLLLFFFVERFFRSVNISSIAYCLVVAMVVFILATPRWVKIPGWAVLAASIGLLLTIKFWVGLPLGITDVAVSISEVIAVATTALLTNWVNVLIIDFENAVDHITIGHLDRLHERGTNGESILYREVRRARNHKRPLALMAVSVEEKSIQSALDRIVRETQEAMAKQYALAGVSKILCNFLEDCDVIVQSNNHFLIALPETSPENIPHLIERLRCKVHEDVGVDIKVGMAALPQDGLTFEGLIDKATLAMLADQEEYPVMELAQVPSEKGRKLERELKKG